MRPQWGLRAELTEAAVEAARKSPVSRTIKKRSGFELLPVKRTMKKHKNFSASSASCWPLFMQKGKERVSQTV